MLDAPCWTSTSTVPTHVSPCTHSSVVVLCVPFSQLTIDLLDEAGVFFLKARPTTQCVYQAGGVKEDSPAGGKSSKCEARSSTQGRTVCPALGLAKQPPNVRCCFFAGALCTPSFSCGLCARLPPRKWLEVFSVPLDMVG